MKIRDIILSVLVIGMIISTTVLVVFAATGISDIKDSTSTSSSDELISMTIKNLDSVAAGIRNSLDKQMQSQYEQVALWATSPIFRDAAKAAADYSTTELNDMWETGTITGAMDPEISQYVTDVVDNTDLSQLLVTDARGYVIAASGATDAFDYSEATWFKNTANPRHTAMIRNLTSDIYTSEVYWIDATRNWNINIANPIKDAATDEIRGVVMATLDYSKFMAKFLAAAGVEAYEVKVINEAGVILATSHADKVKVNNPDYNVRDFQYYQDALARSLKVNKNTPEPATDENGELVYANLARSSVRTDNTILVSEMATYIEEPVDKFVTSLQTSISDKANSVRNMMIIIGVVVAVVVIIVAFLVIRSKITVPLNKLTVVSNKLSQGEIEGLSIDVKGKDEISTFGESFKGVLAAFNFLKDEVEKKS